MTKQKRNLASEVGSELRKLHRATKWMFSFWFLNPESYEK